MVVTKIPREIHYCCASSYLLNGLDAPQQDEPVARFAFHPGRDPLIYLSLTHRHIPVNRGFTNRSHPSLTETKAVTDCATRNIIVGRRPGGVIPDRNEEILNEIDRRLTLNGEAISASRP